MEKMIITLNFEVCLSISFFFETQRRHVGFYMPTETEGGSLLVTHIHM